MFEILLPYLAISVIFNLTVFLIAFRLQSDKLTDSSYALTFLIIATALLLINNKTSYAIVAFIMVALWALRIGSFLLYRVIKIGKDARFDAMRADFLKFGRFWLLQGLSAWILMIPTILSSSVGTDNFGVLACVGVAIFVVGLSIEAIADLQKNKFNSKPKNKGKWISSGLWKYSRHPNYFGEILVWVGLYLYAIQNLSLGYAAVALISPIFIALLLIFVSGIPLLEKAAEKKWGAEKSYKDYKRRTSILVLMPRRKV